MSVNWETTKYNLILRVVIDWEKYQRDKKDGLIMLPPPMIGRCNDWKFVTQMDDKIAVLTAIWDRRKVVYMGDLDDVTTYMKDYIVFDSPIIDSIEDNMLDVTNKSFSLFL
jgi:hypothetical protein